MKTRPLSSSTYPFMFRFDITIWGPQRTIHEKL
jgi:hypothetical protein